jgi:hypothetical protein
MSFYYSDIAFTASALLSSWRHEMMLPFSCAAADVADIISSPLVCQLITPFTPTYYRPPPPRVF